MKTSIVGILALLISVTAGSLLNCQVIPSAGVPGPSKWTGHITGNVHGVPFSLPLDIEIRQPGTHESNPVYLFLGAGQPSQVGNFYLASAQEFRTPDTGRLVTLQYLTIGIRGNELHARLTNDQSGAAAAINSFAAPNLSAAYAPPVMHNTYQLLGSTEMFAFLPGTQVVITFHGNHLSGTLAGGGRSYTGVFPLPDIEYYAQFEAKQSG